MEQPIAKFRFKGYRILKSEIIIPDRDTLDGNLDVTFTQQQTESPEELIYKHFVGVSIKNKDASIRINVMIVGIFEFDDDISAELKGTFFNSNAPAIIFPYLRAYVTTLTGLSGIQPMILPTLNLSTGVNIKKDDATDK